MLSSRSSSTDSFPLLLHQGFKVNRCRPHTRLGRRKTLDDARSGNLQVNLFLRDGKDDEEGKKDDATTKRQAPGGDVGHKGPLKALFPCGVDTPRARE